MRRILQALMDAVADLLMLTDSSPMRASPPPRPAIVEPLEKKPPPRLDPQMFFGDPGDGMGAYRCSQCSLNHKQNGKCRGCGGELSYMANARPTPEEEMPLDPNYKLKDLEPAQRVEWANDLAALEKRARERGLDSWACLLYGDDTLPPPSEEAA